MTYPKLRPELTLDFANSRQLDPRITFSRATGATYLNPDTGLITLASEHEARFEKEGLLIEEGRTNLYETSEDYGPWTKSATYWSITANSTTAPDGTNTATKCIPNAGIANQSIYNLTTLTSGVTYTGSIFFRAGELTKVYLRSAAQANSPAVLVDLAAGTATPNSCTSTIQSLSNGWYRVTMTWTQSSTVAAGKSGFGVNAASGETFDGTNGFYSWGSQLEEGSFPTSYIPTAGQTGGKIRDADIAFITGDNFSSWYNPDESTWYAEGDQLQIDANGNQVGRQAIFVDRYANISPLRWGVNSWMGKHNNASIIGVFTTPVTPKGSTVKTTYAVDGTNGKMCVEGVLSSTGTLSTYPQTTEMRIGKSDRLVVNDDWKGHISRIAYYPRRLTDLELQTITL